MRSLRSPLLLLASVALAASSACLVNCSSPTVQDDDASTNDAVTGVNNALGLGLTYDVKTGRVNATLKTPLEEGDKLFINVRRGVIKHESQKDLDCGSLTKAPPITDATALPAGVTAKVYRGPVVAKEIFDLVSLYNDARWYGGHETPEMEAQAKQGPDPIVEACIMNGTEVKAKLLTNLAYARDRGAELDKNIAAVTGKNVGIEAAGRLTEGTHYNTIDYANLCVQELGEIPFFKKDADGKYETFDCRDFVGSNNGRPQAIPGVEGHYIPLSVDDQEKTACDGNNPSTQTYDCVDKCDRGMFLTASSHTGLGQKASCQPGVTVTTAKNDKGSHWILLCRKVDNTAGLGMMKTKVFNDIAIVGTNPSTGKTCFFQNKENVGNDGSRVTHPADVAQSSAIWPSDPSSYCTENCHAADAFVHSPWIDQAKRSDGHPIVPKMGEHPDFPISDLTRPYSLLNGPSQGFVLGPQLVGEKVEPCLTCHRVAGASFAEFANWATGTGDAYFSKITDRYKTFANSHWMPQRLDSLDANNFAGSKWGVAVGEIQRCLGNGAVPSDCTMKPIPQ